MILNLRINHSPMEVAEAAAAADRRPPTALFEKLLTEQLHWVGCPFSDLAEK